MKMLVDDLIKRGIYPPLIIRFSDILKHKVEELNNCFLSAIKEYEYKGDYRAVFPIKTNQQKQVAESVLKYGGSYKYGLEAGCNASFMVFDSTDFYDVFVNNRIRKLVFSLGRLVVVNYAESRVIP